MQRNQVETNIPSLANLEIPAKSMSEASAGSREEAVELSVTLPRCGEDGIESRVEGGRWKGVQGLVNRRREAKAL